MQKLSDTSREIVETGIACPYPKYYLDPANRGTREGIRILPKGLYLILNTDADILNLFCDPGSMILQVALSPQESALLEVMLDHYPSIAYYHDLLAAVTDQDAEECARLLQNSQGTYSRDVMRPVRAAIARLRPKLDRFNIKPEANFKQGFYLQHIDNADSYLEALEKRVERTLERVKRGGRLNRVIIRQGKSYR